MNSLTLASAESPNNTTNKTLSSKQVMQLTGWSSPTLWRRYQHDNFPAPQYNGRYRVWFESDVKAWLDTHPQCRVNPPQNQPVIDLSPMKQQLLAELSDVVAKEIKQAQAKMKSELRALFS